MLKVAQVQVPQIFCLMCGQLAGKSICDCCVARVQGQAIELKRQAERKGA